jgi:hypothetical protein
MHVSSLLNPFNPMAISAILNPQPALQPVPQLAPQPALPLAPCRRRNRSCETTRDIRLQVQAALRFKVPYAQITQTFGVTIDQIRYIKTHRATPQKTTCRVKPTLKTPQKQVLKQWLQESPSHRRVPYQYIPRYFPEIGAGEQAFRTAIDALGYTRRASKKKGFSTDPAVMARRLAFAQEAIQWSREQLYNQAFSDEVWAMGSAHTTSYVTVLQDYSEDYDPDNLQHKYSKAPAWMFWGSIINGRKGPCRFWEKEWGNIDSGKYNEYILGLIEDLFYGHPEYIFQHDNAPSHKSYETRDNLCRRGITCIVWPPYSPDLNIIEHVWNWMKDWIQRQYWRIRYNARKIPLHVLRTIIQQAWDAVPDDYIRTLYDSWYRRCQAVIDANGGPTKY